LAQEATAVAVDLPRDLSPWGMYQAADWVVKSVMIGLLLASIVTWTVWLAKSVELHFAKRSARSALRVLTSARSLDDAVRGLGKTTGPIGELLRAAILELQLSAEGMDCEGILSRIASRLERIDISGGRNMTRGTGVLATIGSTAPFVGLFGTVWGIMNSFIGISKAQTTNLGGRAGHRGGAARDRLRPCRRDPRGGDLQRVRTADRRLPRASGRCRRGGSALGEPRPRPPGRGRILGACQARHAGCSGVGDERPTSIAARTSSPRSTRSMSHRSST
jgi:tonB-system energizer ExbB